MQKVKFGFSSVISIVKCCLLGVVFTLLGTIIFAVVLKWVDISSLVIDYINNGIIGLSIFFMIMCMKKVSSEKLFLRSVLAGIIYGLISFLIFSALNGGFVWDLTTITDILYAVIVSVISSVIITIFKKK